LTARAPTVASGSSTTSCPLVTRDRRSISTFANQTAIDVPVLMFVTPAGFERYFADGAAQARPPDEFTVVVGGRLGDQPGMAIS
jgi:hypothetical protein